MEEKRLMELDDFMEKLEKAGDNEAEIEKVFKAGQADASAELGESELEMVSGGKYGISLNGMINLLLGDGGAKLTWTGVKVAATCLYDYAKYGDGYRTYSKAYVKQLGQDLENKIPNWMKKIAG